MRKFFLAFFLTTTFVLSCFAERKFCEIYFLNNKKTGSVKVEKLLLLKESYIQLSGKYLENENDNMQDFLLVFEKIKIIDECISLAD